MVELIRGQILERGAETKPAGGEPLADLAPGRVVKGTVVGPQPGGLTLIRLMGQPLLAETRVPLTPGQALTLVVQQTKPQLLLAMAEAAQAAPSRLPLALQEMLLARQRLVQDLSALLKHDLKANPPPSPKAAELAGQVQDLARQLLVDAGQAGDPGLLKRLSQLSGLDLEARLAHLVEAGGRGELPQSLRVLAPALARLLQDGLARLLLDEPGRAAALKGFAQAAQGLADFFEANARLNAELLPREAQILLGLPLAFGQQVSQGEILFSLPQEDGAEANGGETRLVFFLEMSALGPLAVEATLRGQDLRGLFLVDEPAKAAFLNEMLPGLAQALEGLGWRAELLARSRPQEVQAQSSPLAELIRRQGNYLSLRV